MNNINEENNIPNVSNNDVYVPKVSVINPAEQVFEQMDDFELEYILTNKLDTLTNEQKDILNRIIANRKLVLENQVLQQQVKPQVKKLTMKDVNKRYDGFTSIVFLFLITSLYGLGFMLYILLTNGILK